MAAGSQHPQGHRTICCHRANNRSVLRETPPKQHHAQRPLT
ncbi:hypothetical protein AVMA1855_22380 [Acidovorax sp. SUPP1855]|nr:hypothetical protein [Acidovorax sp. SUPP1855]GKS86950.1 hypothetical protein AVMA1855_22380 [Acidovorax sp. SUPP1855]